MRNALAGNLCPSLTACNTRPRWQYTRWLISVYSLLALCLQARVWELVRWWPLGYWLPITILDDLSPDLSAAWSVGGRLVTDHRSPLLAIVSLTSLPPGPRVTLRVVHVVLCCWRHRLPMTDRIKCIKQLAIIFKVYGSARTYTTCFLFFFCHQTWIGFFIFLWW